MVMRLDRVFSCAHLHRSGCTQESWHVYILATVIMISFSLSFVYIVHMSGSSVVLPLVGSFHFSKMYKRTEIFSGSGRCMPMLILEGYCRL
jgi:hypothetical protein